MLDVNVYQENIFHTKMMLKEIDLDEYLFGVGKEAYSDAEQRKIRMQEIPTTAFNFTGNEAKSCFDIEVNK